MTHDIGPCEHPSRAIVSAVQLKTFLSNVAFLGGEVHVRTVSSARSPCSPAAETLARATPQPECYDLANALGIEIAPTDRLASVNDAPWLPRSLPESCSPGHSNLQPASPRELEAAPAILPTLSPTCGNDGRATLELDHCAPMSGAQLRLKIPKPKIPEIL